MASMYALFTFRSGFTPLLTLPPRYKSGHLIDIAFDVLNKRNVRDLELNERSPAFRKLESFFKKLHIKITIGNAERRRTIKGLVSDAGNFSFSKDGMMTTIAVRDHRSHHAHDIAFTSHLIQDHFMETYNFAIRYPRIIGICVSPKSAENPVIYPAEICEVLPGQFFKKKIPEELQGKVVLDFATMRPSQRLDLIRKGIDARGASAKCPTPVNPVLLLVP